MSMEQVQHITQKWIELCKYRRNTYWRMHYQFQRRSNYLAVPLILIASSTGLTSVAQVAVSSRSLAWITAITGSVAAALAAFQKYFRYSERAEQCKSLAKSYGIIGTKLETKQAIHSIQSISGYHNFMELIQFAEEMRQGMEQLMKDIDDAPIGFLTQEEMYINVADTITQTTEKTQLLSPPNDVGLSQPPRKPVSFYLPPPSPDILPSYPLTSSEITTDTETYTPRN